jgi:hydroxypyruvate isomerase
MAALPPLRFSVNIESMFLKMPFEQRLEHVSALGFTAVEFGTRDGKDMNITLALKTALRLNISAFSGSTVPLVDPQQHARFEQEIMRTAALAVDLSCSHLIVHAGTAIPDLPREAQQASIIKALQRVAPIASDADLTILLEPLNPVDHPGSYLFSSLEGFKIVQAVGSPHVRLLFNIYHQQISEGNLSARIEKLLPLIGYIRAADVPGRHEPGTGEINYEYIFALLREKQYKGYVGLDFQPLVDDRASLRAVRAMGQ